MNEIIKTTIFFGLAVFVAVFALASLPRSQSAGIEDIKNKPLFTDIDVDKVQRVRIVKFDGLDADTFEVQKTETGWVLPSHYNYPADNDLQVTQAVTFLSGLIVNNIASDRDADKEKFGVIEPRSAAENIGQQNVGTLIELLGDSETPLASAVIGARVANDESKSFVLVPGRPHIYVVELNPKIVSNEFRDWMNRDLLRFDPYQIRELQIRRVASATPAADETTGEIDPGIIYQYDLRASFNAGRWNLNAWNSFDNQGTAEVQDVTNVNLDGNRLSELANQLAGLQITDVKRKPQGLKADLMLDKEYLGNISNQISLRDHGFFVVPGGRGGYQIKAKGGEILISLRDGVELIVRCGDFARATADDQGKANRYALISARVNEETFPLPERAKSAAGKNDEDAPPVPDGADPGKDEVVDEQAERDFLRKRELREENLKRAEQRVEAINRRCAPWYYVISEDEFKKLTPDQSELISRKP
jgi:hypothetical protein